MDPGQETSVAEGPARSARRDGWRAATAAASLLVTAVGVTVLIGWKLESDALILVIDLPGSRRMMPLTAVAFTLAGTALWLLRSADVAPRSRWLGRALAAALVVLSLVALIQYWTGVEFGIDTLFFPDAIRRLTEGMPGLPAQTTALAFLAAGTALLLLDGIRARQLVVAQLVAFASGFLGIQGLAGYGYSARPLPSPVDASGVMVRMAVHTAAALVVLAVGILMARPDRGVMSIFTGRDPGALIARRLLPAAILVPLVLGWLRWAGEHEGLFGRDTGSALFAAANMVVFTLLIGWSAALVRRVDLVRERAETALRASEARYRTLMETANEGIWVVDRTGSTEFVNPRMLEMLGYSADGLSGHRLQEFFPPEGRASVQRLLAEPTSDVRELRLRRRDGGEPWVLMSTSAFGDKGNHEGLLMMATDVTETRRAREELAKSEARFRSVFESAGIGIVVVDAEGCFLMTNPVLPALLGYTPDELLGKCFTEITHGEDVGSDWTSFRQLVDGKRDAYEVEKRFLRRDGNVVWARVTGSVLADQGDGPPKVIRTVEDITSRKQLEEERARLTAILEATPDFVGTSDLAGNLQSINRAGRQMVGIADTEDIHHYRISDLHAPWALSVVLGEGIPAAVRDGSWSGETALMTRQGVEIPVSQVILAHRGPSTKVEFLSTVIRDLTERVGRERDEQFLLDASRALTASLDEEEILLSVAKLLVQQRADYCVIHRIAVNGVECPVVAVHRDPAAQPVMNDLARFGPGPGQGVGAAGVLQTGRTECVAEVSEAWVTAATGGEEHREVLGRLGLRSHLSVPIQAHRQVLGAITLGRTRTGDPFLPSDVRISEDLAHRAAVAVENCRLYVESRHATNTRDEVLRVVAHDLRNPLSTIRLAAGAVGQSLPESMAKQHRHLEIVERSVELSTRLIEDLLDVARMESGKLRVEPAELDVAQVVREAVELQRPLAEARSITIDADIAPSLPPIQADRDRILQVFSNLIGNAIKFTPERGRIGVRADIGEGAVRFSVVDSGPGISEEDRAHLFEPFWQARPGSMGAGLGLPLARGIVQAHGGSMEVQSRPGAGSTFSFTIPVARRERLQIAG